MRVPIPRDVRTAVETERADFGFVPVSRLEVELAQAFHDDGDLIRLLMARAIIAECARTRSPMELLGNRHAAATSANAQQSWVAS